MIDHLLTSMNCEEKSHLLRRVLNESHSLFMLLGADYEVLFASKKFLDLMKVTKENAFNKIFPQAFHRINDKIQEQIIFNLQYTNQFGTSADKLRITNEDGEITLQFFMKKISLENEADYLMIEAQDVTRSLLRNRLLIRKTRALEEDKNRLQEFTHIVSHNSRNPVNNLKSLVDLYGNDHLSRDEFLSLSGSVINSLELTLNNLSDILRHQAGAQMQKSVVSLQNTCEHILKQFSFDIVRLGAKVNYDCKDLKINFPLVYVESIFSNMLSNAIKYKKTNVPLEMSILAEKVGDEIHLSFKDNGIGIDLTTFGEELFKPYTQENKSTDRGGLGLSILAQHLEQHGDEIRVESQRGEGTTFTFVFKTDSVV